MEIETTDVVTMRAARCRFRVGEFSAQMQDCSGVWPNMPCARRRTAEVLIPSGAIEATVA